MAISGCETGGFTEGGIGSPPQSSGAFSESDYHARGVNDAGLNNYFAFLSYTPDMGSPGDTYYGYPPTGCNNCLLAQPNIGDPSAPYKNSSYMALQAGGQGPIDAYGGATMPPIFFFPDISGWTLVDYLEYQGYAWPGPPPEPYPEPPLGIYVAGWGVGFTAILNRLMQPGSYSGSGGFYYSEQGSGAGFSQPDLTGSVSLQIVSADLTQTIDVTPASCGTTAEGPYVALTFDSVALFGRRVPFFPQVTMTGVSNPWINADYPAQGFSFGPCFQATLT